ncbi:hypothetical protein AFK68_12545 [Hydrocoleum sp. CS-953]|nr:hypothetical protein AFK68_12545 [Hydrocoleum sp. CS-953]
MVKIFVDFLLVIFFIGGFLGFFQLINLVVFFVLSFFLVLVYRFCSFVLYGRNTLEKDSEGMIPCVLLYASIPFFVICNVLYILWYLQIVCLSSKSFILAIDAPTCLPALRLSTITKDSLLLGVIYVIGVAVLGAYRDGGVERTRKIE